MVFACKLSQNTRNRLLVLMLVIIALQTLIGISLIITGLTIIINIGTKLHEKDQQLLDKMFGSLIVLGVVIIIVQLAGIRVCRNCLAPHRHPKCGFILRVWLILSSVISDLGVAVASLAPGCSRSLSQHLRTSLHQGMGQYLHDPHWKVVLDGLQQEKQCCGVERYSDWHRTSWMHSEHIQGDSQTVMHYTEVDGRILPPVVPWSCCNSHSAMPCLHDPLQQIRSHFVWYDQPELVLQTIFTRGCLNVLISPIETGLNVATGILASVFILKVVAMVAARYLYTSARNAMLLGEPNGPAYGWLIGRGDFGCAIGATMEQLDMAEAKKKLAKQPPANQKVAEHSATADGVKLSEARRRKNKRRKHRIKELEEDTWELMGVGKAYN